MGAAVKILSLSEAKMKLSALVDSVSAVDERVMITKNGKPAALLIGLDEFEGWQETSCVPFDSGLMKEIKQGLVALKTKKASLFTLDELFTDEL